MAGALKGAERLIIISDLQTGAPAAAIGPVAERLAAAVMLLNHPGGRLGQTADFSRVHALSQTIQATRIVEMFEGLGPRDMLIVHQTNPAYSFPALREHIRRVGRALYLMFANPRMRIQPKYPPYQAQMPPAPVGTVPVFLPALSALPAAARLENPLPDTQRTCATGRIYYGYYCAFSHGGAGAVTGPVGRSYVPAPTPLWLPRIQAMSDGELYRAMLTGTGHEPVLDYVIDARARWYIVSYVHTISSERPQHRSDLIEAGGEILSGSVHERDCPMGRTASDLLVQRLYDWGIRRVFEFPGDGINGVMGALNGTEHKIQFVQARHRLPRHAPPA